MMEAVVQCCPLKQSGGFPDVREERSLPPHLPLPPEPVNSPISDLTFSSLLLHLEEPHTSSRCSSYFCGLLCCSAHVLLNLLKVNSFLSHQGALLFNPGPDTQASQASGKLSEFEYSTDFADLLVRFVLIGSRGRPKRLLSVDKPSASMDSTRNS
ncbi:uncharacterized [Tachysurus ichikawai]